MARSDLSAPMEVITVLFPKDSTSLAHINEIRQEEIERRSCKLVQWIRNPMPGLGEDLPSQIIFQHTVELFTKAGVWNVESFRCLKNGKNRRREEAGK